ncbi:hypothetical protein Tco_0408409 [Tanacetum coccineum]
MQIPPLFESDEFIYWKNRFETYVKSKYLDLWHVITHGDFLPIENNPETKKDEIVPFEKQGDDLKKRLAKHNEAKMLLRSLPSAWNNIILIMRNKSDLDTLSMDDLYNNLNVYESEIKGQTSSSSNSQNVAFVSFDNSSSTNETVNTAHSVSVASSKDQASTTSYADDVMFSFFANQSNAPQLDNEDLEQIDANI